MTKYHHQQLLLLGDVAASRRCQVSSPTNLDSSRVSQVRSLWWWGWWCWRWFQRWRGWWWWWGWLKDLKATMEFTVALHWNPNTAQKVQRDIHQSDLDVLKLSQEANALRVFVSHTTQHLDCVFIQLLIASLFSMWDTVMIAKVHDSGILLVLWLFQTPSIGTSILWNKCCIISR